MPIMAVRDVEDEAVAGSLASKVVTIDLVIGCGDLDYEYLDYVGTALGVPLRAVHGNHVVPPENNDDPAIAVWWRGIDLHGRVVLVNGVRFAGLQGSLRYSCGPDQLVVSDDWHSMPSVVPALLAIRSH